MFCEERVRAQIERGKHFSAASFWPGSTFQSVTSESDQRTATSLAAAWSGCSPSRSSGMKNQGIGACPVQGSQTREMVGGLDARRPLSL
jgi:hypothetical protein